VFVAEVTAEEREETLRLLSEEGSSLVDRMYYRVTTLKSKNDSLLALNLAVVSIAVAVGFYSVDSKWFPVLHLVLLVILFFLPALISAYYSVRLMIPKEYAELYLFNSPDFDIVSNAAPRNAIGHIVYAKKQVFDKLYAKYKDDMTLHVRSVGFFVGSLFGLFIFTLLELFSKMT
jgi:hypothetical protein